MQATAPMRTDPYKVLWAIGVLLVAIMAAFQVYDVLRRREIVIETTERNYATFARGLAEQTSNLLRAVDISLTDAATAAAQPRGARQLERSLRERLTELPQVRTWLLFDPDGRVLATAGPSARSGLQLAREYLADPRDGASARPHVSPAFRRPDDGVWTVALSRRIAKPGEHRCAGAVVALLDLEYLASRYGSIDLGGGSEASLFHSNGQLLARFPPAGAAIGRSFSLAPVLRDLSSEPPAGTVVRHDRTDGRDMTYALQRLADFPLLVTAAVDNAVVVKPWNIQHMHSAVRTSLFCLSVLLLLRLVLRQLKRREQAEASLRVQTALLDELFESAPEAIVMLDLEQRVSRVNREFTRMFGFGSERALGRPLADLIVPEELKPEARRMAQAVRQGHRTAIETERIREDGGRLHVSELSAPITAPGGRIASYAIYRDVTERRLAEAERAKLESRLRQGEKLEAIGTMAGGIAHDFNSILTAILGYGDMALRAAPEGGVLKRYVMNVMSAANRAKAVVDQILTYSRSTRGKRNVVDVSAVVQETLDLVRASLPANVELRVQLAASRATVIADATHVHQLVMNLCTNAVDAMPAGGALTVALETVDAPADTDLSHGLLPAGHYVRLGVSDTGCGIEPAVLEQIFEPFFTTKEPGRGTGLGLALVHGIVTDLGGAIDVASRAGAGSAFHVYLPRSAAAAIECIDEAVPLPRGRGERVLVVEDEVPLMLLAEEMLAALGYEPAGFARAQDALDEFRAAPSRVDVVVLDYLMPDMTGTELAKQLRALRSDIPIVLVSGYQGPVLLQEALSAGIDHVITKPLDLRQLADAMAKALARVSAR